MRRNCSQCGVDQYVPDDRLSAGWILLNCHQCGGTTTLRGDAFHTLSRVAEKQLRPAPKPEPVKAEKPAPEKAPSSVTSFSVASPTKTAATLVFPPIPEFLKSERKQVRPEPALAEEKLDKTSDEVLKNVPEKSQQRFENPIVEARAEESSTMAAPQVVPPELPSEVAEREFSPEEPVRYEPISETTPAPDSISFDRIRNTWTHAEAGLRKNSLSIVLAILCLGCGAYLLRTAQQLRAQGSGLSVMHSRFFPASSDEASTSALAGTDRVDAFATDGNGNSSDRQETSAVSSGAASRAAPKEMPRTASVVQGGAPREANRSPAVVSRSDVPSHSNEAGTRSAFASRKVERAPSNATDLTWVKVKPPVAVLRAGPGIRFKRVGSAREELRLLLKGSKEGWSKVQTHHGFAWIRSDLISPVSQVASAADVSAPLQEISHER